MYTLNCRGALIELDQPVVMGIINLTPDSFFAGSRKQQLEEVILKAEQLIQEGAFFLDIGAQSTRPAADYLSADEEWERLKFVLPELIERFPNTLFSIDTFHAAVAEQAAQAGIHLINDISGGHQDPNMLAVVAQAGIPFIAMHMKGRPQTMQTLATYEDLMLEMTDYFMERISTCKAAGIKDLILDPGFGFAKTIDQNFLILQQLDQFKVLENPLLVGLSRKSMITKTLGIPVEEALNGTTVLNTIALMKGAKILRVHDVKEAIEAIKLVKGER
jgi:dihydropteroate synthase